MSALQMRLADEKAAWHRRMAAVSVVLRWLCEQLVRALLCPVFVRACNAYKWGGLEAQKRFERRFDWLVGECFCWPCRVEWDWSVGCMHISSRPLDDSDDDFFDLPEGAHFA